MPKILHAIFDGEVLRPEEPVDLLPNTRYVLTVEREDAEQHEEHTYPLTTIRELATDMGVTDLSTRHGWYAHGCVQDDIHGT